MIKLKIVTPERVMLDEEVDQVTLPAQNGEITVLPNHIPLISNLIPGQIKYKKNGQEFLFAVSFGTIEVKKNDEVAVLAETAEASSAIDIKRAEEARERAKKLMQESPKDELGFAEAASQLEKNLARLRVARKHRTHTHHNLESGSLKE
ncbi:MAG TPA: F0F1 ATP synthase subunit epsilon [Patescibacteria group bacterium]|jgi:F-type H+-transporting ATPase subunit epsilon|nr:F0F1 ATP synthase subunit epsilon [Patescibacteria group bacterium]